MIKFKALILLILFISSTSVSFASTDVLLNSHSNLKLKHSDLKQSFTLEEALDRLELISPELASRRKKVEQYEIEATFKPEERATPLTWAVTPFEIPAFMLAEEIRKLTFGKAEAASISVLADAYAVLEYDNFLIAKLEAQNDLKKLYISSLINENILITLEKNKEFFESAYEDAVLLEKERLILPSDLLKIRNLKNEINRKLEISRLRDKTYKQNLGLLIDEKKFILTKENALETELYDFKLNRLKTLLENHPEVRKNVDLLIVIRSDRIYKKLSKKPDFLSYLSITIRRVAFEGPFLMVKRPSPTTFFDLFRDPNHKAKKKLRIKEIEAAEEEVKAAMIDILIKTRDQYYRVYESHNLLEQSKDNLEYHKRLFFEKQKLYEANKVSLKVLVNTKSALYKAELNYLNKLEQYNLAISDLQYYSGNFKRE